VDEARGNQRFWLGVGATVKKSDVHETMELALDMTFQGAKAKTPTVTAIIWPRKMET
jgi:hypothetical protein